jgi:protein involved in polysaccharide export with SLBB domain
VLRIIFAVFACMAVMTVFAVSVPGQEEAPAGTPEGVSAGPLQLTQGILEGTLDPDEYILGAGDVLTIGFWGDVNRSEAVAVNPDGEILVAPVGPIAVNGLSLAEASDLVRQKLSPYYRPSILSVSLLKIRSFQVHVVGAVERPGAYEVNAVTRASQAVALAEGLAPGSSLRNIRLRRDSGDLRVDLSRYVLLGENEANPFLREGDVLYVAPWVGAVSVFGGVYRPGNYEFVEGETLERLLALAGGFRQSAYLETIEVYRFGLEDPTVSEAISLRPEPSVLADFELNLGDRVFVRQIPDWHEGAMVEIVGEVMYPGSYAVEAGMETLAEVIARAGGLTGKASLAEARLIRGSFEKRRFPVEEELVALEGITESFDDTEKELLKTLRRERKGAASISFEEILLGGETGDDVLLEDGDVIEIPRATWYVRVSGHVRNPGLVLLENGEGHGYYIKQAGGYVPGADKGGTRIIRALSGQKVKPRGQEIQPGDIIWVPPEPETDWWRLVKDIIQVVASVATIYLVIDSVTTK